MFFWERGCEVLKLNGQYAVYFLLVMATEIYIALFVRDAFVRPYIGDVLVIILMYCFFRMLFAKCSPRLPVYLCIFAVAVEFGQYFHLVKLLHLEEYTVARIIIGSTFDWSDIGCYMSGTVLLLLWQRWEQRGMLKRGQL